MILFGENLFMFRLNRFYFIKDYFTTVGQGGQNKVKNNSELALDHLLNPFHF